VAVDGRPKSEIVAAQDQALHTKYYSTKNIEHRDRQQMQTLPTV
jgi:hypothetical protein